MALHHPLWKRKRGREGGGREEGWEEEMKGGREGRDGGREGEKIWREGGREI